MDSVGICENYRNFSFGLDNASFSDRILQLEFTINANDELHNHKRASYSAAVEPQVKTIHVSSLILAERSPFFLKLFSNGMFESEQKHVKLQIEASEEASFMDLLKYFYSNNLPTTLEALLDLWIIANKYEVGSCMRECSRSLQNLPMTCESASLYLDLSPTLLMSPTIQPLIDKANNLLVEHFKDFHRCEAEMLDLSLPCVQALLSSDDLQVVSESDVFRFVLKWVHKNYPDAKKRREILVTYLLNLVRFPFMTTTSLVEEVATCSDIGHELASKIVIRALRFKAETSELRRCLAAEDKSRQFVERAYHIRPLKIVELEMPHKQSIAYLQLTKEELMLAFPNGQIRLESFYVGGIELNMIIRCDVVAGKPTGPKYFFLGVEVVKSAAAFQVKYEIATRKKPSQEFERLAQGSIAFTETILTEYIKSVLWNDFVSDEGTHFINDIFYLRADFTIKND